MNTKHWTYLCLFLIIAALLCCATAVIIVDPFQIYHLSTKNLPLVYSYSTEFYANAGTARHYDYDSIVVGTSVTENFRPTQMDREIGGRFIKLCSSGGTAYNHAIVMDLAFRTHDINRVIYGLDVYSFTGGLYETSYDVPFYLYDDNPFNDVSYLLNRSVLATYIPRALKTWGSVQDDSLRDAMFSWAGQDDYGIVAMDSALFSSPSFVRPVDTFLKNAENNLNTHLLPYIEAHPETHFDIFFPPYSVAEWSSMISKGTFDSILYLRGICFDALSSYENVTIYDFAVRSDWVKNIANYKDPLHYGQWINDAISICIANRDGIVSSSEQLAAHDALLTDWAHELHTAGHWIYEDDKEALP